MPAPPDEARRHYLAAKALGAAITGRVLALWDTINAAALDASWAAAAGEVATFVAGGQAVAASLADSYVSAVLTEQNIEASALRVVAPRAFAGIASDGRSLLSLLDEPLIRVKVELGAGRPVQQALAAGRSLLATITTTQVADAGRTAVATAIAARPQVTSYTRMLNPPSCSRCVVLAGKVFAWNQGFQRHPHCDCVHIPTVEDVAGDTATDPVAYFAGLSRADQDRYFTAAGAEAIRRGADVGQVVNVRRTGAGLATAAGQLTPGARLMPETILQRAGNDRAAAIELLRQHGYLR